MVKSEAFEKWYSYFLIGIPILVLIIFIIAGQLAGVDSWFYVDVAWAGNIYLANISYIGLLFVIVGLFSLVPDKRKVWYFLPALFLSGLYVTRFVEPEINDLAIYLLGFAAITILKINPIRFKKVRLDHRFVGYGLTVSYIIYYINIYTAVGTTEVFKDLRLIAIMLPSIYIMFINNKRLDSLAILSLTVLAPIVKIVYTVIPFIVYAVYLDLVTVKKINYSKIIVIGTGLLAVIGTLNMLTWIPDNLNAFEEYCNEETKVCSNSEYGTQFYGHYFSHEGYVSTGTREFGICSCAGIQCLNILEGKPATLSCGRTVRSVP